MKQFSIHLVCIILLFANSAAIYSQESLRIKKQIEHLKMENYVGEGWAEIGDDLYEARGLSKKRALENLAESIEVRVRGEVETRTGARTDKYGEYFEEEFRQIIQTYTDITISNPQEDYFLHYPTDSQVTTIVWISKEEYDLTVSEDIKNKIKLITATIENGNREFEKGDYLIGVTHWIDAKRLLKDSFGRLPVEVQLTGEVTTQEANSYLNRRVVSFFGNIHLLADREGYFYDSEGKIKQTPEVYAQYIEGTQKHPVKNLPLKIGFVRGAGRLDESIITGLLGQGRVGIRSIDPGYSETVLDVTIGDIEGLELFPIQRPPMATITLKRLRTAALSVSAEDFAGHIDVKGLWGSLSSIIGSGGFSVVEFSLSSRRPSDGDIDRARKSYADYLVVVSIWLDDSGNVPDFNNMYYVLCSGVLGLYDVASGTLLHEASLPKSRGLGTTLRTASQHAYNNVRENILNEARNLISKMK